MWSLLSSVFLIGKAIKLRKVKTIFCYYGVICFLNRTGVKCVVTHCEATSADVESARKYKSEFN